MAGPSGGYSYNQQAAATVGIGAQKISGMITAGGEKRNDDDDDGQEADYVAGAHNVVKMARGDQVEGLEDPGWSADRYGNANLGDYTYGPQDEYIDKHEKSQRAITVRQERVDKPKPQPTHNHPQYQ